MMCLRFLVSLPFLVLALLALSFQQGSAEPTTATAPSSASAASCQSTRPSSPSFMTAIRQPAAESRTPAAAAAAAAAPALLIQRADPVAENKTEPAKPAGARMPKCVRKTEVMATGGMGIFDGGPIWVRTFDVSEMEQEGVSDSDLEAKLMLKMRRKCRNVFGWQYFPNRGDGKGATVLFSMKYLTRKKCVGQAFREAGFPKDFKC